jgi:hypothetical protein
MLSIKAPSLADPAALAAHLAELGASDDNCVTLLCPEGAETAPISHGPIAFEPYRQNWRSGPFLVDVPPEVARHLCYRGGFSRFKP